MLGRLHLVLIHLPLGLLAGVVVLRLLSAWYGERYRPGLTVLAWLCAAGGVVAAITGWILMLGEGNQWGAMGRWHQWLGTSLAVCLVLTAWLLQQASAHKLAGRLGDGGIILCAILAGLTGHYGGQMTHGRNFLFGGSSSQPSAPSRPDLAPAPIIIHGQDEAESEEDRNDQATVDYQALWQAAEAVIVNHCVECHNSDRARGYLNLETYELIMRGGGSGPAVRPGEPQRSPLLTLAELPEDNWDRMPPEGNPLDDDELDALRQWIKHGAPGPETADND